MLDWWNIATEISGLQGVDQGRDELFLHLDCSGGYLHVSIKCIEVHIMYKLYLNKVDLKIE